MMRLRPMTVADATDVEALTRQTPEASAWSTEDYANAVTVQANGSATGFGIIAEEPSASSGNRLRGFIVGRIVADEAEILNLAVAPDFRRRGAGRALVAESVRVAAARGVRRLFLEVRQNNFAARALYEKMGFSQLGVRPNYYCHPSADAAVLERMIQ